MKEYLFCYTAEEKRGGAINGDITVSLQRKLNSYELEQVRLKIQEDLNTEYIGCEYKVIFTSIFKLKY